jgi:hypothetical protein
MPVGAPVPVADIGPAARSCPRAPTPPEYRFAAAAGLPPATQAVIDGALAEWRHWGGQIVDYRAIDWARTRAVHDLVRPGVSDPESGSDDLVVPIIAVAGCWENDPRMFRALRDYWRPAQVWRPEMARRERYADDLIDAAVALSIARSPGWAEAWSAAFLSYLVTGVPPAGEFDYSRSHAEYVAAALAGARHRYAARPIASFAPRPGDLICSYRNQSRREAWEPAMADWRLGPAHCDVVVAVERADKAGRVFAVGGNIFQSVTVSVHALAGDGRFVDNRFRNWAVVLADRASPGGL